MAAKVRDHYVDLRGLRFHYRNWDGGGPPLILLHGLASNSHIWDLVAPLLAQRFSVVALDQRSHGESTGTDHGYDFATIVQDLLLFTEALALRRPLLVGHSWGGNVVLEMAAAHGEDVGGLVLVDGGFINLRSRPEATWEEVARNMAPPNLTHLTMEELAARAKETWGAMWRPEVEAVLRASFQVQPDGKIQPRLHYDRHMKILRALWEQNPQDLFPKVQAPVLILPARRPGEAPRGAWSRVSREELVTQAQARLPRARMLWLEDSIHDVPLQRPELVAGIILQTAADGFFDAAGPGPTIT